MGRFTLSRFLPDLDLDAENHIGGTIVDGTGRLAYLKTAVGRPDAARTPALALAATVEGP
jgi:hypothetical protein